MSNEASSSPIDHPQFQYQPPTPPLQGYQATGQQQQQHMQWSPFLVQPGMRPSYPQRAPVMGPEQWNNYGNPGNGYPLPYWNPYPSAGIPVSYSGNMPSWTPVPYGYNPYLVQACGPVPPNCYPQQMPMPTAPQEQNNRGPGTIGFDLGPAGNQEQQMPPPNQEPNIGWKAGGQGQPNYQGVYQNSAPNPPQQNFQQSQGPVPGMPMQHIPNFEQGFYPYPGYQNFTAPQNFQVSQGNLIPGPAAYPPPGPMGYSFVYFTQPGMQVNYADGPSSSVSDTIEVSYCEDAPDLDLDPRQEETPTPRQLVNDEGEVNLTDSEGQESSVNADDEIKEERKSPEGGSDRETESRILQRQEAVVDPCVEQAENCGTPLSPPPPPPPMLLSNIVPVENSAVRSNLMEEIRGGVQLNSVDSGKRGKPLKASKSFSAGEKVDEQAPRVTLLHDALKRALSERYRVNHDDEDDATEFDWVD